MGEAIEPAMLPIAASVGVELREVAMDEVHPLLADMKGKMKGKKRSLPIDGSDDNDADCDDCDDNDTSIPVVRKKRRGRPAKPTAKLTTKQNPKTTNPAASASTANTRKAQASKLKELGKELADGCSCRDSVRLDRPALVDAVTQTDNSLLQPSQCSAIQCDIVEPVDAALSASVKSCITACLIPVSSDIHSLNKEMEEMKMAVAQLSSTLSAFIDSGSSVRSSTDSMRIAIDDGAAAVNRPYPRSGGGILAGHSHSLAEQQAELQRDVVASMYVDIDLKKRRARNIVVNGVPYGNDDFSYVTNLLAEEFELHYIPTVSCRRIGKERGSHPQPILVTLESREDASYLIANAKFLRQSRDSVVRQTIYISADLTPAEAKAAYEIRCRRRQQNERNQQAADRSSSDTSRAQTLTASTTGGVTGANSGAGRH